MPEYVSGSDNEILPGGSEVEFVVENASERESSNGNELIELELRIQNGAGKGPLIFDNLTFVPKSYWKVDAFRLATGETLVAGQKVVFNAVDCVDRKGRAVLKVETWQSKSRNKIDYYVVPGQSSGSSGSTTSVPPSPAPTVGKPGGIPF
jgi:hypothetical protein